MPRRNVTKVDAPDSYYHIYSRGINKGAIFLEAKDYSVFLNLIKRYLSNDPVRDKFGREYPHLSKQLELLCFCLLPNHIHLLIYQIESGTMQQLMRGAMTSYSNYFNKKYGRSGPLFESRYKASLISSQAYLDHISRYIHLNPGDWRSYPYSSLLYFQGREKAEWLKPNRILEMFDNRHQYLRFVADFEDYKLTIEAIGDELANI